MKVFNVHSCKKHEKYTFIYFLSIFMMKKINFIFNKILSFLKHQYLFCFFDFEYVYAKNTSFLEQGRIYSFRL